MWGQGGCVPRQAVEVEAGLSSQVGGVNHGHQRTGTEEDDPTHPFSLPQSHLTHWTESNTRGLSSQVTLVHRYHDVATCVVTCDKG